MWITPTYLGKPDEDARVHVYFMWGEFDSDFSASKSLEEYLRRAGNLFGERATFLYPQEEETHSIWKELTSERLEEFASHIQNELAPCLLFTDVPLRDFDPTSDHSFTLGIPSGASSDDDYREFFARVHREVSEMLKKPEGQTKGALSKLWDAVVLQPNIFGVGVDAKEVLSPKQRAHR